MVHRDMFFEIKSEYKKYVRNRIKKCNPQIHECGNNLLMTNEWLLLAFHCHGDGLIIDNRNCWCSSRINARHDREAKDVGMKGERTRGWNQVGFKADKRPLSPAFHLKHKQPM